jgi:amino acid adenylation domain-containing protein
VQPLTEPDKGMAYSAGAVNGTSHSGGAGSESKPPVLTGLERDKVLYEWNGTRADFPDACVHQLFEEQADLHPDAIAVVGGAKCLTYGELNERANQVAHFLRKQGIGPDVLVGVCLERTPEMVVALLGVLKSGGAYVPLDPSYPEERLSFMVDDAAVRVLLTEDRCRRLFPAQGEKLVCLDADWPLIAGENSSNPDTGVTPENLAYVMYTSGSTGKPKGAMILHRGLVNYLCWAIRHYGVQPGGTVPVHSSISFDLTVTSLYPALLSGGQVELLPEDIGAQNLLAALRRKKDRNLVKITPAHLEALSLQLSPEEVAGMTRVFVIGGENLPAESLRLWRNSAPATRLINEYGPTETVVGCCVHEVKPEDPQNGSVPIGRPIANTQLYILDENLDPVPLGEMGELYIGGTGVARGYLNRPDLTRERFLPDPFLDQNGVSAERARMYRTGDLARYREDGVIEYLGRIDNQVKIRGYRIELGEIEAVLAGSPQVQSCAVLAREDTPGEKQLVGYLVSPDGSRPATEELQGYLKDKLPEYMIPSKFVHLALFPLTHNGKIDRKALPAPANEEATSDAHSAPPRNATEEALTAIWKDMFKIESVGIHDDFFDLGGHSLMAIRLMSRIRTGLGADLPVLALFENPTIAGLAESIAKSGATNAPMTEDFI